VEGPQNYPEHISSLMSAMLFVSDYSELRISYAGKYNRIG
jgi:hypothetical protein